MSGITDSEAEVLSQWIVDKAEDAQEVGIPSGWLLCFMCRQLDGVRVRPSRSAGIALGVGFWTGYLLGQRGEETLKRVAEIGEE